MSIQLIRRAQLLIQQDRYLLAEEQLRLALAEGSETATAHALLALCLLERFEFDAAAAEAQQAIHDAPDAALGFYALASVQYKQNRLNDAQATIAEAIRLEPWNAEHFSILSSIEADRYHWPAALAAAEQGLECDPDHVHCNNLRAFTLVNLGRKAEAGQSIGATLAKSPEDAVTHANQAWTLLHQQQPIEAATHFREALRLDPNLEWARQGIIEAMKARFFLYRWLLTWFLWLTRFPPKFQLALMLGLIFGRTLLANLLQMVPLLEPLAMPLTIAYVLFVWMTWTASSLFNLVLRLDSFGRLVLNPSERLESTLVGVCLVLCLLCGSSALFFVPGLAFMTWTAGMLYLGLMLPLIAAFRQPAGRRGWIAAYAAGVAVCVVIATYQWWSFCALATSSAREPKVTQVRIVELNALSASALKWTGFSTWGIVISTWIGAGLSVAPRRN
jgi:tetratricopeptide (TPR) repeat protein